jgi:hypothetical protein
MSEVAKKIARLHGALAALAPKLCPTVVPKQFGKFRKNPVKWCTSDAHRDVVAGVIESEYEAFVARSKAGGDAESAQLVLLARVDPERLTWRVTEARWCASVEENLLSLEDFLKYACCSEDNGDDVRRHARHFLEANGHAPGDTFVLQQCYSSAYALKVLLGNVGTLRALAGASSEDAIPLPVPEDASADALVRVLKGLFAAGRGERGTGTPSKRKAAGGAEERSDCGEKKKAGNKKRRTKSSKRPQRKLRAASYEENAG